MTSKFQSPFEIVKKNWRNLNLCDPYLEILHEEWTQQKEAICRKKTNPSHYYYSGTIHFHKTYSHSHQHSSHCAWYAQMQNLTAQNTAHSSVLHFLALRWQKMQPTAHRLIYSFTEPSSVLKEPQFLFKQKGLKGKEKKKKNMTFITFSSFLYKDRCPNVHYKTQDFSHTRQFYGIKPEEDNLLLNVLG